MHIRVGLPCQGDELAPVLAVAPQPGRVRERLQEKVIHLGGEDLFVVICGRIRITETFAIGLPIADDAAAGNGLELREEILPPLRATTSSTPFTVSVRLLPIW